MFFKNIYCTVLVLFVLQVKSQIHIIAPYSESNIKNFEIVILQEKFFGNDTVTLKKHLQPLLKKNYTVIYEALLANGFSNFYNLPNTKSKFHYLQSLQIASSQKSGPVEIWTQLNYVSYLYHYRDYITMTPLLLKIINQIEKKPEEHLILPGESFKKIGWILQTLGDYEQALKYLNLAKKHTKKHTSEYASIINAIGTNYFKTNNFKLAESYFEETAKLADQIQDELRYAKAIGDLALIKQQKGDYKSAISLLEKDIQISENKKNSQNTIYASILLAKLHIVDKNFDKAETVLNNIQSIVRTKSYFEKLELQIIELKLEILGSKNKIENELELRRRMIVLEDSLKKKDGDEAINRAHWVIQKTKFKKNITKSEDKFKHESALKKIYGVLIIFVIIIAFIILRLNKKKYPQLYTKQLLEETEEERKRIALDLHDSVNHELLSLKKSLEKKDSANKIIDSIINNIRSISRNLHPVMFDKVGLELTVNQLVERAQAVNDFMITVEIVYGGSLISSVELQIYRIIQEALSNIIKYADPVAAKISIIENKNNINIEIKDNGKGFNVQETLNNNDSFGLHNIIERSRAIGGKAKIISNSNGTIITIEIKKKI